MRTRRAAQGSWVSGGMSSDSQATGVVRLDDAWATDSSQVGAKAAALAKANAGGLPVLPGFVLTTSAVDRLRSGNDTSIEDALVTAWRSLTDDEQRPVIVRSSSTVEDGETESHAGVFTSVLGVRTWNAFQDAVRQVIDSADGAPMAVLVQPFIEPKWAGVLFGVDPVTSDDDHLVVAAVPGGPDRLVSGVVDGIHLVLTHHGRVLETSDEASRRLLGWPVRRSLAQLSRRVEVQFGGHQDIEWAVERNGRVVLLQSRPITTLARRAHGAGPVLGPGPVAETFGGPLAPLEEDLWVAPLREGLRRALTITGAASRRQLAASPVVVTVGGRVAADLRLLGVPVGRRSILARLDPRPPARRLVAAWRVGRLRAALPALAEDVIDEIDADLRSIPPLETLDPAALLRLLRRSHQTLTSLHGYEALAGLLLDESQQASTAAAAALRVLATSRSTEADPSRDDDEADDDLVARYPVLLALVPPSIEAGVRLPAAPSVLPPEPQPGRESERGWGDAAAREMLRLRIRWVQELTARAARALGAVLVERGAMTDPGQVAWLPLERLALVVRGAAQIRRRPTDLRVAPGPPLPAAFQLSAAGEVVPLRPAKAGAGRGAGGGRGVGPVHNDSSTKPAAGSVLVVRNLDPALAGVLPELAGLVAETGSVLSHLAILAREYGIPTVVGVEGAVDRFRPGVRIVVDGSTGEVAPVDDNERGAA